MNNVKLYHVGDNGLQEGEALGRISVVLKADVADLQTELKVTKQALNGIKNERNDIESELTKANTFIKVLREQNEEFGQLIELQHSDLTKARELLVRCQPRLSHCSLLDDLRDFLAHQSA